MTRFFLPGAAPGDAGRLHDELRADTERRTGRVTRATRIYALSSRREGSDTETRVGEQDPCSGATVHAIFATTEGCTVISAGGHVDLSRRQIYEVIPFES
jgi:hypothetical protein